MEINECLLKRRDRLHSSWIIAALSSGLVVGAFVNAKAGAYVSATALVLAVSFAFASFFSRTSFAVLFALLAGTIIGAWRVSSMLASQNSFELYKGREVVVSGRVSDDPTQGVSGDIRLRVVVASIEGAAQAPGEIWVSLKNEAPIKRSDQIVLQGQLSAGFGTFAATMYRAEVMLVNRADYADVARDARDEFAAAVREGIREPEASLGVGFLLGQKAELPEKLLNELRLLGLTHIVVASGYNLTILVRFARRFFMRVSRFGAFAASLFLIFVFTQMTGATPSMSRASLIAGLSLIAWYFGRVIHPLVLLPFTAALTLVLKPAYAQGDIGWMLSFASFVGVIIVAPLIHAYFWGEKRPNALRQLVVETLSAQLVTIPIVLFSFELFSPLSLLSNILVVPLIPFVMLGAFLTGAAAITLGFLAVIVGFPTELALRYITFIAEKLSAHPFASVTVNISMQQLVFAYVLMFVGVVYLQRRTHFEFRKSSVIE